MKLRALLKLLNFILVITLVLACSQRNEDQIEKEPSSEPITQGTGPSPSKTSVKASVSQGSRTFPPSQKAFLAVLDEYRDDLDVAFAAGNQLKYSAKRLERDKRLCEIANLGTIEDWVGLVLDIRDIRGKAQVNLQIEYNKLTLSNDFFGNEIDGFDDRFLIGPSSPMFKNILELDSGMLVKFSGKLVRGDKTCISNYSDKFIETSTHFRFQYSKLKKLGT